MANTILITANWHTGALSQQTISRQYDNNRYVVQFVGYPEASEGNELDYYLLVWMSSAPGEKPDEIAPIQLASDQWHISNVFTQQTQQIKFQMCALNTEGTFEAHSPIFTGFVRNSLDHDGTAQDIDVSTLFDAYREYLNELIIRSGAVVIDSVPTQGSTNAVSSGGVYSALQAVEAEIPDVDPTLTQSGQAADAKVTGDKIDDLKEDLSQIKFIRSSTNDCDPNAFTIGLLNSSGVVDTSYTSRKTTDFIPVSGNYVSAYCHQVGYNDIGPVRIAFYKSDKTFDRIIITSAAIVLPVNEASFVRVSFAINWAYYFVGFSDENAKMQFEEYYSDRAEIRESALPERITATDNWIYKFAECDFVGGNVHLSIDDVGSALYDLTANNPTSLWDSNFFGQLKTLHETYGICITCNCFSYLDTIEDYDIASVPNTWASEFVVAKDWLKFAFHAKDNTINYNTADSLKTDYEYFVSAIYHMTGNYDCIDTGTRLTMFTGTESQIKETMSVNKGITMLWSADDDRNSYYFNASQTTRVNNRGKYIDGLVGLLFVKSMPRLDNHTIADIEPLILTKPQYGKIVELYCHENLNGAIASGTITRINNALAWFDSNGYTSHFLSDIFN